MQTAQLQNTKYLKLLNYKASIERSVLGTILLFDSMPFASDYVEETDFSAPRNLLFREAKKLQKEERTVDYITFSHRIMQRPNLVTEFNKVRKSDIDVADHLPHHCMLLVETNIRLKAYKALNATVCEAELLEEIYLYASDLIDTKNDLFDILSVGREFIKHFEIPTDAIENAYAAINEKKATIKKQEGLKRLLKQLDSYCQHRPDVADRMTELFKTVLKG